MLDYSGSVCIKDIEKANGFMHVFKEEFTVNKGQLPIFPDKNFECDYNAIIYLLVLYINMCKMLISNRQQVQMITLVNYGLT